MSKLKIIIPFNIVLFCNYFFAQSIGDKITFRIFEVIYPQNIVFIDSPVFKFIERDTMEITEIVFLEKSYNYHKKDYFIINNFFKVGKVPITNVKKILKSNLYISLGSYCDFLRPSHFVRNSIETYNSSDFGYRNMIKDSTYYVLYDSTLIKVYTSLAIVQKYYCYSKKWYKYYFPLKRKIKRRFEYFEIVKILDRKTVDLSNKYKKIKCNVQM